MAVSVGSRVESWARPRTARVALVNMPWARLDAPSIQCGLLKAGLTRRGHSVDVHYLNLELVAYLGAEDHHRISACVQDSSTARMRFLGEWLFGRAAFGDAGDGEVDEYLEANHGSLSAHDGPEPSRDELRALRQNVLPDWVESCAERIAWQDYDVVGFTSTFEQNVASFALARRIKQRHPQVVTVFGGANFDGGMGAEYLRVLPWIDYVVMGEGDEAFPSLVEAIAGGESPIGMAGVRGGDGVAAAAPQTNRVERMDDLPVPHYDEYFSTLARLGQSAVLRGKRPTLLFESSRGCWWGQKHQCTFCGLNAHGLDYRAKSSERVVGEVVELARKHRTLRVDAVDNVIDSRSRDRMCSLLSATGYDFDLFYEVKTNLTRADIRALREAGVRSVQPGVESLSSHLLKLMNKGSSMLTNVRFLKWAHYYQMAVSWNMLMGFPQETDADYQQQAQLIPLLVHLPPPGLCQRFWLERFSPQFRQQRAGVTNVRPQPAYRLVYPIDGIDHEKIAYFFEYDAQDVASEHAHKQLADAVDGWAQLWAPDRRRPELRYLKGPGWLRILDTRFGSLERTELSGRQAAAYEYLGDTYRSPGSVARHLGGLDLKTSPDQVTTMLQGFVERHLVITERGRFLSLALPVGR
ncbi:MAG: RiPP maturation radical SAM C-methyltransferase [Actinomycetes bacterium]